MTQPHRFRSPRLPRLAVGLLAGCFVLLGDSSAHAQDDCFDQVNTVTVSGGYVLSAGGSCGQEFVPTEHSVDTVELHMNTQTTTAGQARVRLRRGSITGRVLGQSAAVSVTGRGLPTQLKTFRFDPPVEVEPGVQHVLEVVHASGGSLGVFLTGFGADTYPLGASIQNGTRRTGEDLWFREGRLRVLSVPDQLNVGPIANGWALPTSGATGQEFVPTEPWIEIAALQINAQGSGATSAFVRIRRNSITGPILGTSDPLQATGTTVREEHFRFATPVLVQPGLRHVLEVVHNGGERLGVFRTAAASYSGGRAIAFGTPQAGEDLWFELGLQRVCGVCQRSIGFQGPGSVTARMCGQGLAVGDVSDYELSGAPAAAMGVLALSFAGNPNVPIAGGTLASGAGLALALPFTTDGLGRAAKRLDGVAAVIDLVAQSVVIDPSIPTGVAFSNALLLELGR